MVGKGIFTVRFTVTAQKLQIQQKYEIFSVYSTIASLTRSRMLRALLLKLREGGGHDNNFAIQSREEFTVAACHAAFEFLPIERHNEFANWLYEKAGDIFISNPNQSELIFYNKSKGAMDVHEADITNGMGGELIETAAVKMYLEQLNTFLEAPSNTPFLLVGPAGAAKSLLIEHAVHELSGYELITINCTTQLTPAYVIHCLKQVRLLAKNII